MSKKYLVVLSIIFGLSIFIVSDLFAGVLGVPQRYQEETNWCWAGCSEAIMDYKGNSPKQCRIVNYAWNRNDCCYNGSSYACNRPNFLTGSGSIKDILWYFERISSRGYSSSLSFNKVKSEINSHDPFVIRWGWHKGGGHFVVGYGYKGSKVYLMDPWNGKTYGDYNWVVYSNSHEWTHSLTTN